MWHQFLKSTQAYKDIHWNIKHDYGWEQYICYCTIKVLCPDSTKTVEAKKRDLLSRAYHQNNEKFCTQFV